VSGAGGHAVSVIYGSLKQVSLSHVSVSCRHQIRDA